MVKLWYTADYGVWYYFMGYTGHVVGTTLWGLTSLCGGWVWRSLLHVTLLLAT